MNPNATLISTALTILALVLAIFGASWLNQRAIDKRFDDFNKRFDDLKTDIDARFKNLERQNEIRFAAIEARLDRIERQLEALFKPALPR